MLGALDFWNKSLESNLLSWRGLPFRRREKTLMQSAVMWEKSDKGSGRSRDKVRGLVKWAYIISRVLLRKALGKRLCLSLSVGLSVGFYFRWRWWRWHSPREGYVDKELRECGEPEATKFSQSWRARMGKEEGVIGNLNRVQHRRVAWMEMRTAHTLVLLMRWHCFEICPECASMTSLVRFLSTVKWVIIRSKLRHSFLRWSSYLTDRFTQNPKLIQTYRYKISI